jgi:hypothetical protein
MLLLWIYLGLTVSFLIRLCYVMKRDGSVKIAGWQRVIKILILDTALWPYYVIRYGLESLLQDLR